MPKYGFAALLFASATATFCQVERASIIGNVTDASGAAVPGVTVTVTNENTNTNVGLTTDDAGAYTAVNLIPGSYSVSASRSGFRPMVFRNFVLQVGQSARLDIRMEVGNIEQTVEVSGRIPLLQTENASVGQVISREAVSAVINVGFFANWEYSRRLPARAPAVFVRTASRAVATTRTPRSTQMFPIPLAVVPDGDKMANGREQLG